MFFHSAAVQEFAMNRELKQHPWTRPILWDIVLAAVFGAFIFTILIFATGGVLISLVSTAVALVVFGLFHFWIWGRALSKDLAQERERAVTQQRQERDLSMPGDEFTLVLNEQERVELVLALEQSLAQTPVAMQPPPHANAGKEVLRGVLDRLRGFGA